ncbi:FUSC family protein [Parapedobacter soli]|uniref:FUSC family protein n=1 Tax=Parapedobacter soli TaxID=416955 RepID=UPI0021C86147|nr:FUSC family protein [Parapedobacter soli]
MQRLDNDYVKSGSYFAQVFTFRRTNRAWHLPPVAGLCVGVPLLLGLLVDDIEAGKLASVGALVILYTQSNNLVNRMMILMACGFGFIFSFTVGIVFSFSYWLSPLVLGVYTFGLHYALFKLDLNRPPGNFFFTMIASMAISAPKDVAAIPTEIGHVSLGVMIACTIGLIYSLLTLKANERDETPALIHQNNYVNIVESIIFGVTVGASLLVAKLLQMENPYWIPISCMAVMQGISVKHVWTRAIQRVLGTIIGLILVWGVLQFPMTVLGVCICILALQIVVEFLVVRNYAIAAVFITMLTIFLAEPNIALTQQPGHLIQARLLDTVIGSVIGALGGWMLYHERIHFYTKKHIRRSKILLKRMKSTIK